MSLLIRATLAVVLLVEVDGETPRLDALARPVIPVCELGISDAFFADDTLMALPRDILLRLEVGSKLDVALNYELSMATG